MTDEIDAKSLRDMQEITNMELTSWGAVNGYATALRRALEHLGHEMLASDHPEVERYGVEVLCIVGIGRDLETMTGTEVTARVQTAKDLEEMSGPREMH